MGCCLGAPLGSLIVRSKLPDSVPAVPRPVDRFRPAIRSPGSTGLEGVPSAFAATRDGIDVMLRDRGLRRTSPEQTAESLLRGAHASAVLEGSASSLEEVRAGHGDEVAPARRAGQHRAALAGAGDRAARRCRRSPGCTSLAGGHPGQPRLAPRAPSGCSRCRRRCWRRRRPALIVAALVHAELATAAPFASHDGIVARAAERLVMVARGVDPASLVVPEAGHLALRAAYESNLRGYRDGGAAGCTRGCCTPRRRRRRAPRRARCAWPHR